MPLKELHSTQHSNSHLDAFSRFFALPLLDQRHTAHIVSSRRLRWSGSEAHGYLQLGHPRHLQLGHPGQFNSLGSS